MEEEGGEEDTQHVERENVNYQITHQIIHFKVQPDRPDHITGCADCDIDPSELLTEADSVVFTTTTTNIMSGKSKEGNRGEDNEGGLSVEDLQRGFREEV